MVAKAEKVDNRPEIISGPCDGYQAGVISGREYGNDTHVVWSLSSLRRIDLKNRTVSFIGHSGNA